MSLIYETRTLLSDLLRMTFSQRESRSWRSLAYQFASLCLVYALLMQTVPHFAFARSSQSSKPSASKQKTADKSTSDLNKSGAAGTLGNSLMSPPLPSGGSSSASVTDAVITRHKPTFNTGSIDGSLRVLLGESFTINGSTQLIPDLLVPGSPSVVLNGGAQHEGVVNDGGSATPTNYTLTLNGGVKLGKIHTRVDAIQLPTDFPTSVPASGGTRTVTVQSQSAVASIGNWQTVRDLNVNGSNITVDVPPGNYRTFTVNGNSKLKFSAGTYNLANTLTLDGSGSLQTTGVITINVGGSLTINSGAISPGSYTSPGDVQLNVLGTVVNVNGSSQVTALLRAYNATVTLNGTSQVRGQVIADKFILNGGKVIGAVWPALSASCPSIFGPRRFDRTNGPPNQYVEQFSLPPGITSPFTLHIQNGATDGTSRVSSATVKLNGVDLVTPSDLNQNVASLDRTVTLSANNQLDVRVASAPGSYLIINICGTTPATDTTPPLIAITSPGNNTTTTAAEVSVSGTASDTGANASGIAHVYVNGVEAAYNSAAGTWIINNVALNLGAANQINATAVDQAGNQATATISITRESPENQRPTANAGTEQTITLPQTASLHGTASDDGLPSGSTLTVNWTKVSGPGTVTFSSPTALDTTATFSVSGTYVLRLTASDGALTQSSDVTIIVQPQNQPPTVTAGPDQTIALPHTATLNGTVTDDGSPVGGTLTTTWSKVSGPGSVIFEDPLLLQTVATFSEAGPYVLRLTASDSELSSMAEVTINVQPQNQAPSVNAGADQTISLPNGAQLIGSASDDGWPAGSSLSTSWSVVSGPGPVTFANPNATSTVATFNVAGEYILRLTAGDGDLSNYADIKVVVTPPNAAPLVVAGDDQIFSLPQDTTTLNGSMLDDGLPIGSTLVATWSKISGPGTVVFGNANNPTTTAQFSAAGTYKLRLTGTDGALTSFSEVQIRVTPANQAPSVSAGPDQTIALPSSANLNGSTSDDGLPLNSTVTTNWSKVSGPGDVAFAAPSMTVTTASFSAAGTYVLRLTASDSQLSNSAEVTIVVQPENQTPSVNAGIDQTIALPSNATLDGTVTDDGYPTGSSVSVTWSKVSGPGTVTFGNAS
ncbi:MAG TPA: hypothetical protein VLL54_12855, partial [Pyrinomonadaceae bacterium]|nr:hypothetical protein [Pyrinomonadaceae bacterium]